MDLEQAPFLPDDAIVSHDIPIPESENSESDISASKKRKMGAPFIFETPEQLQTAVDLYFQDPSTKPWRISGLADYLQVTRKCLLEYRHRSAYESILVRAKTKIESAIEAYLLERGGPAPGGVIFNLCNNFESWHQKQEQDLNVGGQQDNPIRVNVNFTKVAGPDGPQD